MPITPNNQPQSTPAATGQPDVLDQAIASTVGSQDTQTSQTAQPQASSSAVPSTLPSTGNILGDAALGALAGAHKAVSASEGQNQPAPAAKPDVLDAAINSTLTGRDDSAETSAAPKVGLGQNIADHLKAAFMGPDTAIGTPVSAPMKLEGSGVSDIAHGNFGQGLGKIWDAEKPHVRPGSPLEKGIQLFNPDFHGEGTQAPETPMSKPIVEFAHLIDKDQHPVEKAIAESVQSLVSPNSLAILASTGGLGMFESPAALGIANRLLSAGFSAQAMGSAYQNLKGFKEAYDKGDVSDAEYQLTHAVLSGTLSAISAKYAATGEALPKAANVAKTVREAPGKLVDKFRTPEEPAEIPATAKPVAPHVEVETPLDDAVLRKSLGGKDLSADARNTIRQHVGDTIPEGSSAENTLLKAVKPVNDTIAARGADLDRMLENAPKFSENSHETAVDALSKLSDELPGGTEETLGKAISKEMARYKDRLDSTDPKEINTTIRDLDKRIKSYTAPEEPLETAADAADAARVTLRRVLRNKLNTEMPETQPVNAELGKNLEVRALLRKRFGDIADDSAAAEKQYASELAKGQKIIQNKQAQAAQDADYQEKLAKARGRQRILKRGAAIVGGGVLGGALGHPIAGAVTASVADQLLSQNLPEGYSHVVDSAGDQHFVPTEHLDTARGVDTGLQLIRSA